MLSTYVVPYVRLLPTEQLFDAVAWGVEAAAPDPIAAIMAMDTTSTAAARDIVRILLPGAAGAPTRAPGGRRPRGPRPPRLRAAPRATRSPEGRCGARCRRAATRPGSRSRPRAGRPR